MVMPTAMPVSLAHLYAIRALVDVAILSAEREAGVENGPQVEAGSCPECKAPPDQVTNMSTLDGAKKYHCNVCGHEWEPVL